MPANTSPIFTLAPDIQWINAITTARDGDLTAGTNYLAFSADATNGGFVHRIRFQPTGTNGQTTVATVARIWINNGSTIATVANSVLIGEITLPASTISLTGALAMFELPLNFPLPAGYKLYVTIGTTQTTALWAATVFGGKY